jgi:hypothetical protein
MKRFRRFLSIMREKNARLMLLLGIVAFNVVLWLGSSLLAYFLAPAIYGDIPRALWESGITWMLEPGFYDPATDVPIRVISIVVIIVSMVTFSGGIIAYMASLFAGLIESARQGRGKTWLYDHILILNWNHKAPELIADYAHDDEKTTIVVLSDQDKQDIERRITRRFGNRKDRRRVTFIVREGDVCSASDLEDVAVSDARTVIILSPDQKGETAHRDIGAIKTAMLLSSLSKKREQTVIVEVEDRESHDLINGSVASGMSANIHLLTIMPDMLMGQLIAQTLMMPELADVYSELFSFDGAEFHNVGNLTFDDVFNHHDKVIPVYRLGDRTYVMAEHAGDIESRRQGPPPALKKLGIRSYSRYRTLNLVIFGNNRKREHILKSVELYGKENRTTVNVTLVESNDAKTIRKRTSELEKIDTVLILSEDGLLESDIDSEVLITLLMVRDVAREHGARIVIELLDPRHLDIALAYGIDSTIISNTYVSRLMTQVSKDHQLMVLYDDLLTYDEGISGEETVEAYVYAVEDIYEDELPLVFGSVSELVMSSFASGDGIIVVGMVKDGVTTLFKGNLDKTGDIVLDKGDRIVAISK